MSGNLRTPKRKLGGGGGARSGSRSRRSSTASTGRSGGRRSSGGGGSGGGGGGGSTAAASGSNGRSKRTRRNSDKWNVKADDPDAAQHEQAAGVATTQAPLSKSALKRKYSRPVLIAIDLAKEAAELRRLPADQWDKVVECLERIRAVANAHPEGLVGHEEAVFAAVSHCVPNARSAIPRHALNTLQAVLANLNHAGRVGAAAAATAAATPVAADSTAAAAAAAAPAPASAFAAQTHLAQSTRALVLLLLKTSATHDKKFIKAAATRCLTEATAAARGSQAFAEHFTTPQALQHRSRLIVAAAVAGFQRCVEQCPPEQLAAAWDLQVLAASLQRVFTASASNARSACKAVVRVLRGGGGGDGAAGLDAAAVATVRAAFAAGRGITPADAAVVFKAQRLSARKKTKSLPRPWLARGGGARARARAGSAPAAPGR